MFDRRIASAALKLLAGAGVGWLLGRSSERARLSMELADTYKNLIDYGRTSEPKATVRHAPPEAEERVLMQVGETAITNLTEHLAAEANVSLERAREEAERLVANFETYGAPPGAH
jgi:hypothetical protein